MSPERVSVREEGEVIPCRGNENRKGAGTSSGESGARNLEARVSDAEQRVWESDTFIAENVYLVLNSLLNWKPVEKLKQKSDVVNFMLFSV